MKKMFLVVLALAIAAAFIYLPAESEAELGKKIVVFDDANKAFTPSGWMGDSRALRIDEKCPTKPHSGKYCQKWTYALKGEQENGWAGVYYQYPANNWGKKKGYNLTGYKKMTFWARGDRGGEVITVKAGGITGPYPDSFLAELGDITLTPDWKEYTMNLSKKDLSNVVGGFCFAVNSTDNPKGCIFYFDDIVYE